MAEARPHVDERLGQRDTVKLAKRVAKDHNLRALLLRLADDESVINPCWTSPLAGSRRRGLTTKPQGWESSRGWLNRLTPLGRDVVEHLRPAKWVARPAEGCMWITRPDGSSFPISTNAQEAQRIVDLLNADVLAAAKRYQPKEASRG